jgi:hypothetical protein
MCGSYDVNLPWNKHPSASSQQMCGSKIHFILRYLSCHHIGRDRAQINMETHIMRSTVVKKDTASHDIVLGSSRAEINAETIMWRSTVGNKDNWETIMNHSTVVKKDTASHDIVHGSSRAEINAEMNMKCTAVVQDNATMSYIVNEKKRGFQHVYKSNITSSSRRVREAYNVTLQNGSTPQSTLAATHDQAKKTKKECLATVVSSLPLHSLCESILQSS